MSDVLTGIVTGDALRPVYLTRAKAVDEKTVAASSPDALALKVSAEEADGWRVIRSGKRSARVVKDKSVDRQLEDDVWALLYRMGFKEMNFDRNFAIQVSENTPKRQLDVFAKDDETAFIVECTHSRDGGPKSVKSLLDKLEAIREEAVKAVHKHYGRGKKLKIKFAIATRNIDWRSADKLRAENSGIGIITDDDLRYFNRLTGILKTAARYQFLGRYLEGQKVEGLKLRVPATRGKVGGKLFYNFLISPHDLVRISYISHKRKSLNDDIDTYQRMVKPTRLAAIGRYIDEGGTFPTNVVINLKRENLQFDVKESFGDTVTGTLSLPGQYGAAWVIDGQHRLYGYAYSARENDDDRSVLSVVAYENLPVREEIKLFIDINTQQVKVNRNLVNEIVSTLNVDDADPRTRLEALCARVALKLDDYASSPLRSRILTVAQDKNHIRCLTLTSLADGLSENNLLGSIYKAKGGDRMIMAGPLADPSVDSSRTIDKSVNTLARYLRLFSEPLKQHWNLGDEKGGYLATNLGLRALLQLLRRLIEYAERKDESVRASTLEPDEIVDRIEKYVRPLVEYFQTASQEDIASFRSRGSSLASVDHNSFRMMSIIHGGLTTFMTPELGSWIANQDAEGTKAARDMIDEINRVLFEDVISRLKDEFGDDEKQWWMNGVPLSVRNECDARYNADHGKHDRWQYLFLVNYADIVLYQNNWELFKDYYNFYGKGKKADLVRWIVRLNSARTITHHAEKGPLSKDQVDYVRRVFALVKTHIQGQVPVNPNFQYIKDQVAA